ncbi:adenylate kinase family protein [Haladaptatus sp. F3-133]|jgi:adenylate kinase|uniref:Putative adenylate kinase n=1 Tax=Halorutilus salinus TaxID=2487751 RepID=A0A9Q4C4K5_9EURY|nr:adenylate kinase family protein [Halorutilus salinus]MCX2819735.1 adenylate kinase family protein [Halorutilus salinus]
MRIAVTGTPGVGKTTVARRLADERGVSYVDITRRVREGASKGYDEERQAPVADVDALRDDLPEDAVFDGHLSHRLEPGFTVVLRCEPDVLRSRLEERGWGDEKIDENAEAEALDVTTAEALDTEAPVFEFDTTEPTVEETVERVARAVEERDERTGVVDWSAYVEGRV